MITYKQLSEIIRKQLAILFPDKYISSGEATSKDLDSYEMQFHIVVEPGKPHLIIGFTKEADSSMVDIWNGKRMNKVMDIDTNDNFIRRYHEPKLYDPSTICLGYYQVASIYNALETFLNCEDDVTEEDIEQFSEGYREYLNSLSKKKHPLQDSPTFPEEDSAECEISKDQPEENEYSVPVEKFNKPIDPFKMVPIFNVDAFEVGYPYLLKNLENGKMGIVTLHYKSEDNLCFNYWDGDGEDAAMSYSVSEFQGAFELYKINEIIGGNNK